jgi:hypothetical protein
VLDELLVKE